MALNLYQYTPSAEKYGAIATPVTSQGDNQQGLAGDMLDSATAGLFDSVGGVLDLVGAKGFAKDFYGWADDNRQEMSDQGRAAISKSIIEKNDAGEWSFGEGASDLDTWLLGFANMAGQFATSVVPGAGAGALAAKAGLAATGVNAARIAGYAAGGGSAATGQAMEQGRQEVMAMPDDVLMKSERFADAVRQTYKPDMTDDEAFDTAKAFLADQVAQDIRTDPKVLLANYGASAIGDPIIGRALAGARIAKGALRSAGKGFVTEGATEAVQAGTTQYGVNEALQPIDGRDAWDGVDVAAANEGIMGGVFGGVAGGVGGVWNRGGTPEPVRDPEADAIRDKNPDLASAFDGMAQSAAQRESDLQSIIGGLPAISQPALEGELLDPEQAGGPNYNPNQIGMQARIGGPTIPRIEQKDIIFAADGRTEAERNPAMEGEWLSPEQRAANAAAGFIENAPIDLESEQVKQAKADMERMRNQPRQITDKNIIFTGDGRPQQAAQEYVDNLQRQANQAASVPRLPQKDIIFAGDQSGVRVKGNGQVYQSPREAMTSKQARAMKRSGTPVEAVPFGDGWGWRVKETQPEQVNDINVVELTQQPEQATQSVELAPIQLMKSGKPFSTEAMMLKSASYKAAAATGAELEPVKVEGGFGFRVKAPSVSDQAAVTQSPETDTAPQDAPEVQARPAQSLQSGPVSDAPAADLSGEAIDGEWTAFADDSGTLKIPRAEMPQIKAEHRGAMTQFLKARGVSHEQDTVPAAELKPTQAEFSPSKVAKAMEFDGGDRSILVSSDGYVLDGHHQWLAKRERGEQVDIIRFDAPITELVKQAHDFPSSTVADGATAEAVTAPAELMPETQLEASSNNDEELPAILRTTRKKYIAQQVKQQKLKETSPGYAQAVSRLEEQYEADIDRAQAGLTFEQFNAINDDSPESVNKQAYNALRKEFGLPTDLKFSRVSAAANVVEVDTTALPETESLRELSVAALDYAARNFAGSTVQNAKTGHQITISKNGVKHTLRGAQQDLIKSVVATPELLKQAEYLGAQPHKSGNPSIVATHYYGVKANIGGVVHDIVAVVHEQTDGKRYYDHSIERKQTGVAQTENSNVSLATPESTPSNDVDSSSIAQDSTTEQPQQLDSKKPEQVRLIGSQSPLSGSPDQVSVETVQPDSGTDNPDIQFTQQNTIRAKPARGVNAKLAKQMVSNIMQRLNGAAGIKVVVLETQAEAEKLWQMSLSGDLVRGAYNRATNTAYVIAENVKSLDELREVVAHEVIGHGGLQNVISKADYTAFIDRLKQTRNNRAFAKQWAQIDNDYDGFSEADKAEELFAYFVQNKPVTGPVKFWWNALKRFLHKALVSVGLAKSGDPDVEAMQDMLESIMLGFQYGNNGDFDPSNPDIRFSKTRTAEELVGKVSDLVGRKRLDPDDPYAVENRRLKEQDRTLWDKAKQIFMRNFAPGGLLPRSIFEAKITRDGELESGELAIKHLILALERAVQKDTGKNIDNQSDEFVQMMADALTGKVSDKVGPETKAALVAMRQYIDALSGDYLSVIQSKIDALTEQIKQDDQYTDKVKALNEIELYEKIKGNMGVYVNRSYRAFDDPEWFQKVPVEVINRAREYLRGQYKAQGDDQAEANRKAEVTLNKILKTDTAYDSIGAFIAESKLGAKDLSTLIARKDISPEIRELLGEYKDPRMNFAKTATKMARLVWNSRFLDKVKADGVGVIFFDEDSRPAEATVQIAGDQSKTYEPLNGYWTYPEVAQALQDSLDTEQMEAWYEAVVKFTSMVKYGKTVLSPTTAMRNWQSAMFFAVANGHFDFKHMKKSLAAFREQVSQNASGDDLAYLKKLKKLGVVYDAPYAGEMMQLLADSKIDEWLEGRKGKVFGTARQINNLAQGFYSFGDDFWKIIGYENEKANFMKAGLSEADAEKMAAERIRNTYPTYSMVGRAIKKLARFPLMGTFVSFPAEIIRTTANMLRYSAQDMKSDNPAIRAMARKRLTGMALVSGMFYALSAMTAAMLGVDDEEEEAIRDVGPSWQKNSTFLFYGRDDTGKLQYFDISFLDPYGYFKRPITAMLRDQPWEDAAASGAADMLSPFFGADITAGTFFQVFANKKQSGGQVYNEYADGTDQLVSIADHIWTGLRPGFVNNAMGIFNAAAGNRREGSGKEYDLGDEMMALMGWRASSLDAPTALYYRSFDFADQLQAANSTLNKVLRSDNDVDEADIADAKEEAQRQYDDAFKQMQRIVQSGRNAGMTKEQVYRTLKLSGVSNRNISGLVSGNIPPMQAATLQTQVKAVAKAREIRGDEQASEVLRRFQLARQLQ